MSPEESDALDRTRHYAQTAAATYYLGRWTPRDEAIASLAIRAYAYPELFEPGPGGNLDPHSLLRANQA